MKVAEYKAYLKNQLIAQQYVVSQKQEEIAKVAATDEEIRSFYAGNKASFVWNDMIKAFMIIVPKGSDNVWDISVRIDGDKVYLTYSRYLAAPRNFVFITANNYTYSTTTVAI